jgi:hypothetical protein
MNEVKETIYTYVLVTIILVFSLLDFANNTRNKLILASAKREYTQPVLVEGRYPWTVRSVDTQIISKHWPKVSKVAVEEQVDMIADLGVNYIAIGTPYDREDEIKLWAETIHARGINVWFRSHWLSWEGDEGVPADMTPQQYLDFTYKFIIRNPDLFREGDAFTVAVEAEQVGVGLGRKFLTWDEYRQFLRLEITVAGEAFEEIGLGGKIHTNWLSMNGWVVANQLTKDLADEIGLIVVDHFVEQSRTFGELNDPDVIVNKTIADLDSYYTKHRVPILLGEWGYQIFQDVPEEVQAEVVSKMLARLKNKSYLIGINYWTHMGNTPALIDDEYGANLRYKQAAYVLGSFYELDIELNK